MHRPLDISVVGAGVAGLVIAVALAKAGRRVVVFERFATSLPLVCGPDGAADRLAEPERLGLRHNIDSFPSAWTASIGLLYAIKLSDATSTSPDLASALSLHAKARRGHVRFYQMPALMTPFFRSHSGGLAPLRDLTFDLMKLITYLRREMLRTLASLKTGLFTHGNARAACLTCGHRRGRD